MSLKARIRGLEAKVEWLEMWGELRKIELQFKLQQKKREIADRLAADPKAAALFAAAGMSIRPTPRPAPPPAPPPPPPLSPVDSAEDDSLPCGAGDSHMEFLDSNLAPRSSRGFENCSPEVSLIPNALSVSSPKPYANALPAGGGARRVRPWTHDPPEHMQIEKVTWRFRTLQDDLDDEEEEEDEYYDPLRDPSWAL